MHGQNDIKFITSNVHLSRWR